MAQYLTLYTRLHTSIDSTCKIPCITDLLSWHPRIVPRLDLDQYTRQAENGRINTSILHHMLYIHIQIHCGVGYVDMGLDIVMVSIIVLVCI